MIEQGTDGLSRGIWMSSFHSHMKEREMLQAIFAPVLFHQSQIPLLAEKVPQIDFSNYFYYHWDSHWSEKICFDRTTIWCSPPELGRQLITFLMNMWVERPYTTLALIIIPRTCSASYWGLSGYIHHKGTIVPAESS